MKALEVVMVLSFFAHVTSTAEQDAGPVEYAILFDAGSSGTRMEITRFLASGPSLQPSKVIQLDADPHKVKPGLDDLHDDPSQVEAYLVPLLDAAKEIIPQDKQSSTPIFLLATAGMRLLPKDQSDALLNEVRKLFNDKAKCPFLFQDDNDARIIKGWVEGIYSWVTINFLQGVFGTNKTTYGGLDLGGASHQNAWDFDDKPNPDVTVINVGGRNYSVFSRSYLGYGQDQARETYLEFIAKKKNCGENPESAIQSPCHNKGFKEPLQFNGQQCIFEGTAKVKLCKKIIRKLLFCQSSDLAKCPFSDQPKLKGKFYGMSAIYYVLTGIDAVCSDCKRNIVTPRKVIESAKSFCDKVYNEISGDPYAKNNCFGGIYIYELFTAGYQLGRYKLIRVSSMIKRVLGQPNFSPQTNATQ